MPFDRTAAELDQRFLESYGHACALIGDEVPVIVVLGDALVVYHEGQRRQVDFATPAFHLLKTTAHAPVALFALLYPTQGTPLDEALRKRIVGLREHVSATRKTCEPDLVAVLDQTATLLDETLAEGRTDLQRLERFAHALAPTLQALVERATVLQLQALHGSVEEVLSSFSTMARSELQVVVTGDHQARVRSLGMQYFQKRFGEPSGADDRVTYAEGASDADDAFALVAKRRLDFVLAAAFFGDERRLQRDVLGDAARDALAAVDLPRIE